MNIHDTFTSALGHQSREEPERLYVLAGVYWRIMLFAEFVAFGIAVAVGAYLLVVTFFSFGTGKTQETPAQNLNKEALTNTVQALAARKELFRELQAGASPVPDPSR
jgi:hypothetical protein